MKASETYLTRLLSHDEQHNARGVGGRNCGGEPFTLGVEVDDQGA